MRCVAVIPARFASTRLPGKPLADILGKPMIQHVHERVARTSGLARVIVATDDARIADVVRAFGGEVVMTSPDHPSGTDRLVEVQRSVPADVYLNVQGDEPLVEPAHLSRLVQAMADDPSTGMATLCHPIAEREADDPNAVKVVMDRAGRALYFSRARIPHVRNPASRPGYLKHVGVYAYRAEVLEGFGRLPHSALEGAEMLEQLRLLEAGVRIQMIQVADAAPGVDSPACLERVRRLMAGLPARPAASLADVTLVITDVDGVLTDGGIWYDASGESLKRFHVRDGLGIKMLQEVGVPVAVVSGRDSPTLRKRLADLGISSFALGVKDKGKACLAIMAQHGATAGQTACLGDDSIDLPAFAVCGWPVAVADAASYVKAAAALILQTAGGQGAFREFSDALLAARDQDGLYKSASGYERAMNKMTQ